MIPHPLPHLTNEEKLEIKRYSGQLSCAECRRLKVKCNKKVPCSSCVRRGCGKICPNGTMTANRTTRGPRTSDNSHLYRKIDEMSRRITELEVALSLLQARISSEVHPLLQGDQIKIKYTSDACPPENDISKESSNELPSELEDGLGTLAVGEHGDARYFGRSGGSEMLFTAGEELDDAEQTIADYTPPSPDIARLSNMFPLGEGGAWDVTRTLNMLVSFLPPKARASALCEVYLEQACWTGRPIWRNELINEVVTPIYQHYNRVKDSTFDVEIPLNVTAHKLAVLFLVFCLGALMDLTIPAYSAEADNYFKLGRASLTVLSVFDATEIWTVQAVLIMAQIHTHGGPHFSADTTWCLISLACKLAQRIGLHRESPRWNLDAKMLQRRRTLFWELFGVDTYFSLHTGRPPTLRLSYVDCQLPSVETSADSPQDPEFIFHYSKYKFVKEVMTEVIEVTLATSVPRYQTILDLDMKTREKIHAMHVETSPYWDPSDGFTTPTQYVRFQARILVPTLTLIHIHRSFFAQALLEHPGDPLASPYAASFLAAFRSASCMISVAVKYFSRFQELLIRWWAVWNSLFTSAIIVGSIVIHAPQISIAPKALAELDLAVDLFEKGATSSARARSGLAVLKRLQRRAMNAISEVQDGGARLHKEDLLKSSISDFGDELEIFAGHTKVMITSKLDSQRSKGNPRQHPPNASLSPSQLPVTGSCGPQQPHLDSVQPTMQPATLPQQWPQMSLMSVDAQEPPHATLPTSLYAQQPYSPTEYLPGRQPRTTEPSERLAGLHAPMLAMDDNGQYDAEQFSADQRQASNYYGQITSADLGMATAGVSGMDARWVSFMLESGILHSDLQNVGDLPQGVCQAISG